MKTLIIAREEVAKVLTPSEAIRTVQKAFKAYGLKQADMPAKTYLYFKKGDLRAMPAYVHGQGLDVAGIKSVSVHPENRRYKLPTVTGVIILTDPRNGYPLAILDGTYLTNMRTGAAGALAAKLLSRHDAKTAGFVGCGDQARTQLECLLKVRRLSRVIVWERSPKSRSAQQFCSWAKETYGLEVARVSEIDEATLDVDILVTTTPSREPLVSKVSPGVHINAIGADAEGKQEISPRIMRRAKIVIDDWNQASHSGEINVPLRKRQLARRDIYAELGEIAAGMREGRASKEEITLFDSTGLAIQDVTCAFAVYNHYRDKDECLRIDLI